MLEFEKDLVSGALFDMDGTMFDTERLRFQTLKQASKELIGVEFSDSYLMACLGLSAQSAEALAQQQYGQEIPYTKIRQRADELELETVRQQGVPIKKGLVQVLERLRKSGLRMAVATSSRRAIAEEYLINANVYKFFDVLVCGDEVEQGKPHPEIFLTAAQKLNLEPQQCLMFEDSENGICAAHAADGICILLKDIKQPNEKMLAHANYYFDSMYDCLAALDACSPHLEMPNLQDSFPQTLNQLTVGIHGFGAIGGGYIAQILSHWDGYTRPKKIYASTRNTLYRSAVNAFGTYSIRYGQVSYDERIENVQIIDAEDLQQMHLMYIESSLIALCLAEDAIQTEAETIAQGLYARYLAEDEQVKTPLTFLIILNKVGAKHVVLKQVRQALTQLTDSCIAEDILQQHYFCDTVVNRMVSKLSDQHLYRQLCIKYNIFKQYQLEEENSQIEIEDVGKLNADQEQRASEYVEDLRQNFQPSHILQHMDLILFNAETDMPIYVENQSPLLAKMRQMILVEQIADIQLIKNRLWNGVHAMMAWYSSLLGHSTVGIAMGDIRVQTLVKNLLDEVQQGLLHQLPERKNDLTRLAQSFHISCQFAFKDPCERVARDPERKLSADERVFSSLAYNISHDFSHQALLNGTIFGYKYLIQQEQWSIESILKHLQQQLQGLELVERQQHTIYEAIEKGLKALESEEQAVLDNVFGLQETA